MSPLKLLIAIFPLSVLSFGCDENYHFDNALPYLTWVASSPVSEEEATLSLWIKDLEGDPVDLQITWKDGADEKPIALLPGGSPLLGLPTRLGLNKDEGQLSQVSWDLRGLPQKELEFSFTLRDLPKESSRFERFSLSFNPFQELSPSAPERLSN